MFKRAMKPGLESVFTHKERSGEDSLSTELPMIYPESLKENPETIISASVLIEGTLTFERSICINGSFTGELIGGARLHIGPTGYIKADINLESALIEGRLEGNVHISGHLEIAATATVKGDIIAKTITVKSGAILNGLVLIS